MSVLHRSEEICVRVCLHKIQLTQATFSFEWLFDRGVLSDRLTCSGEQEWAVRTGPLLSSVNSVPCFHFPLGCFRDCGKPMTKQNERQCVQEFWATFPVFSPRPEIHTEGTCLTAKSPIDWVLYNLCDLEGLIPIKMETSHVRELLGTNRGEETLDRMTLIIWWNHLMPYGLTYWVNLHWQESKVALEVRVPTPTTHFSVILHELSPTPTIHCRRLTCVPGDPDPDKFRCQYILHIASETVPYTICAPHKMCCRRTTSSIKASEALSGRPCGMESWKVEFWHSGKPLCLVAHVAIGKGNAPEAIEPTVIDSSFSKAPETWLKCPVVSPLQSLPQRFKGQ